MYPSYNFLQNPMNNLGYLQQLQQMQQMQQGQQMSPPSQPQMPSVGAPPTLGQNMMQQPQKAPEHGGGGGMSPLMALSPMLGLMQSHPGAAMFGISPALGFARMLGAFK